MQMDIPRRDSIRKQSRKESILSRRKKSLVVQFQGAEASKSSKTSKIELSEQVIKIEEEIP
jgi:hypothetical protein